MKNNTRKILLALLVIMTLLVSMATVTAFAEETAADESVVYLNPGDWASDSARFAIYTWDGGDQWFDMTDSDGDGIYECTLPEGVSNIIFCRMNPDFTENRWNTNEEWSVDNRPVWNQTTDLVAQIGGTFTITDPWAGDNKGATGTWEGGTVVEGGNTDNNNGGNTNVDGTVYTVAGSAGLCYSDWSTTDTYNDMTYNAETGLYEKTFTGILAGDYECKVVANHSWDQAWGGDYGDYGNYFFTLAEESDVTITFDPAKGEIGLIISESTGAAEDRPVPEAPEIDTTNTVRIYLSNSANWQTPYFYCWTLGDSDRMHGWPGAEMEWDGDKMIYYVDIPSYYKHIIFNDGNGTQTADLDVPGNNAMFDNTTNTWGDIKDYTPPIPPENTTSEVTVYVKDDLGWGDVYIYFFDVDGSGAFAWPGTPMDYENGFYTYTIPAGYCGVVFSNGGSWEDGSLLQTVDLRIPTDGKNHISNSASGNDGWYSVGGNQPGGNQPGGDQPGGDQPVKEMTFIQKMAKALLLFLRSIEDFFKGFFKKN